MSGTAEIRLIAILRPRPEQAESLRQRLTGLVAPTRREQGCREYTLHENLERPEFVFYEAWASQADLDRHLATPALKSLIAALDGILAEPMTLLRLRALGETAAR